MAETCKPPRKAPMTVRVKSYRRGKQRVKRHSRHKPR